MRITIRISLWQYNCIVKKPSSSSLSKQLLESEGWEAGDYLCSALRAAAEAHPTCCAQHVVRRCTPDQWRHVGAQGLQRQAVSLFSTFQRDRTEVKIHTWWEYNTTSLHLIFRFNTGLYFGTPKKETSLAELYCIY